MTIKTGVYGIEVTVKNEGGTIISQLKDSGYKHDIEYCAAIDGLEALILAHACAGIDITTPAYLQGIETAVDAITNGYD